MTKHRSSLAIVTALLLWTGAAPADFEAGQQAWDAGRAGEALGHWRLAADTGDARAMLALGRLYEQGLGAPQNFILAHMWLNLAASRGNAEALPARDALAARMTPEQLAAAQEQAAAWRPAARSRAASGDDPAPPPPRAEDAVRPPASALREAQELLTALGYRPGPADGKWGERSIQAYRSFLSDIGEPGTDGLSPGALRAMREIVAQRTSTPAPSADADEVSRDPPAAGEASPEIRADTGAPAPPPALPRDTLHRLVVAGDIDGLHTAIRTGADVNARDQRGWTPLMHAANAGHALLVSALLDAGATFDTRAADGATALFIAALHGHEGIVRLLARAGADLSVRGPRGRTPLEVAELQGRERTAATLMEARADRDGFRAAEEADTAEGYDRYLASHPDGVFAAIARGHRDAARDREAFGRAQAIDTIDAFNAYREAHPDGEFAAEARRRIAELGDPVVFAQAQAAHTAAAYADYLARYPDGEFAEAARQELVQLRVLGAEFRDCETCPAMVVIPAGSFDMGSDGGEAAERPQHRVTIAEPLAVGKLEVTFEEFEAFVRDTGHDMADDDGLLGLPPANACFSRKILQVFERLTWRSPGYRQDGTLPAVCVSWNDAVAYTKWLSIRTGNRYRLLSEAEWEYAARAGTATAFSFGGILSTNEANYDGSHSDALSVDRENRGQPVAAGSFPANPFGLHDMHGNVLEWVEDCWHPNHEGAPADGRPRTSGRDCSLRVVRGGSWFNHAPSLRSAYRSAIEAKQRYTHYGFRVARAIDPQALLPKLAPSSATEAGQ